MSNKLILSIDVEAVYSNIASWKSYRVCLSWIKKWWVRFILVHIISKLWVNIVQKIFFKWSVNFIVCLDRIKPLWAAFYISSTWNISKVIEFCAKLPKIKLLSFSFTFGKEQLTELKAIEIYLYNELVWYHLCTKVHVLGVKIEGKSLLIV